MTPYQASKTVGCTVQLIHYMIRNGKIKARKKPILNREGKPAGYTYDIALADVTKFKNGNRRTTRGTKRSVKK